MKLGMMTKQYSKNQRPSRWRIVRSTAVDLVKEHAPTPAQCTHGVRYTDCIGRIARRAVGSTELEDDDGLEIERHVVPAEELSSSNLRDAKTQMLC